MSDGLELNCRRALVTGYTRIRLGRLNGSKARPILRSQKGVSREQ